MVDSNRRFKKRFVTVFRLMDKSAMNKRHLFSALSTTDHAARFISQQTEYLPLLIHAVGFFPPAQEPLKAG